jgi:hypothetical protein
MMSLMGTLELEPNLEENYMVVSKVFHQKEMCW